MAEPNSKKKDVPLDHNYNILVKQIASCEREFLYLGKKYYKFPNEVTNDHSVLMRQQDRERRQKSFVVTNGQPDLEIMRLLTEARRLRDKAKRALNRARSALNTANVEKLEDCILLGEAVVEDVEAELEVLNLYLWRTERSIRTSRFSFRIREHLPDPNVEWEAERYRNLRAWILRLPESQKALELGISNEDEVVEAALSDNEELLSDDDSDFSDDDGAAFSDDDLSDISEDDEDTDMDGLPPLPPSPVAPPSTPALGVAGSSNWSMTPATVTEADIAFFNVDLDEATLAALAPRAPTIQITESEEPGENEEITRLRRQASSDLLQAIPTDVEIQVGRMYVLVENEADLDEATIRAIVPALPASHAIDSDNFGGRNDEMDRIARQIGNSALAVLPPGVEVEVIPITLNGTTDEAGLEDLIATAPNWRFSRSGEIGVDLDYVRIILAVAPGLLRSLGRLR